MFPFAVFCSCCFFWFAFASCCFGSALLRFCFVVAYASLRFAFAFLRLVRRTDGRNGPTDGRTDGWIYVPTGGLSIQGWLDLNPENMAAVFCANGKARTSVLLACYLRFEGEESTAMEAYRRVWAKRDPEQEPEQASRNREEWDGCEGILVVLLRVFFSFWGAL